jgi:hypothetical protein
MVQALNKANEMYSATTISITKITSNFLPSLIANFKLIISENTRWRIAIGIAIRHWLECPGIDSQQGAQTFVFQNFNTGSAAPPKIVQKIFEYLHILVGLGWRSG